MPTGVQVWSGTPVTNATADSNVNWAEGMAPSQVNDSSRALMASVAKWRDDNNTTLITSGSSAALTLVTNQVEAALTAGYTVAVTLGTAVDTNATLAVDGLGAIPIQLNKGTNIVANTLSSGDTIELVYSSTGTGQWYIKNTPYNPQPGDLNSPLGVAFTPTPAAVYNQTTTKMMGLGGTVNFSPKVTGRVYITANYNCNASITTQSRVALYFGAGGSATAPTSGAAVTGTSAGTGGLCLLSAALGQQIQTSALVTTVTVGTSYWVDMSFLNNSASVITSSSVYVCIQEF